VTRHDAVIVGAGPAGLATALALSREGLSPIVLDARTPPIDKACGEGVMPDGREALESLGVVLSGKESAAFDGIRWIDGDILVDASFPGIPGLGIRRTRLHRALVDAAERSGIPLLWSHPLRALDAEGVRTDEGLIRGRWIVGADGMRSTVRRLARLEGRATRRPRFGVRRHFAREPWSSRVEVWWDDEGEAYVTPVGGEEIGLALLSRGQPARFADLARRFPELARRLEGAPLSSSRRGAGPLEQRVRALGLERLVLVGDAAGYLDAITGEGLALSFRQARALARVVKRDAPRAWPREHRRIVRRAELMTRVVLLLSRHPPLRRRVMRALADDARSFEALLALHVGAAPTLSTGAGALVRLARALARPTYS
jgi:flavin-dependent dehydrogenase